ncbi:TKL family protein kinase [Trichomonas vaginalis G3]|uniref:TKL family protein kinase n=1 Tax=Trichomonas vaginalis (strain ATCC PRA-98 / G3) TaxID=412133 RepID=A2DH19_TRIV3|nr:protein serine/threonine kinase protein [Trichomonas vaginalis G3]EAY20329.1 TKL family protein kinase [Trichomonas vaginalis G3]KAI5530682.1 protein serine/threonine kinase protein [Trichomonas vaginalis G3]|eukprot:XP_001581315.1 TKL family protein kinase [Trichomonas vaginalis G3]
MNGNHLTIQEAWSEIIKMSQNKNPIAFTLDQFNIGPTVERNCFGTVVDVTTVKNGESLSLAFILNLFIDRKNIADPNKFAEKIQQLTQLSHPALIKVIGIVFPGEKNRLHHAIVRENNYICDLSSIFEKDFIHFKEVEWDNTRKSITIIGLAAALRYLHEKGLYHLFLVPWHILFDSKFEPILDGFYLSSSVAHNQLYPETTGYDSYIPKEDISEKFDVYSFGAIVFEILVGHTYKAKSFPANFPNKWAILIVKCLQKNPAERPTIDQICREINAGVFIDGDIKAIADYKQRVNLVSLENPPPSPKIEEKIDTNDAKELYKLAMQLDQSPTDNPAKRDKKCTLLLLKAGQLGSTDAQFAIAARFLEGKGVQRNPHHAERFFTLAAEGGNTMAMSALARIRAAAGRSQECIDLLTMAGEKDMEARVDLAEYLMISDPQRAIELLKSSETPRAKLILAKMAYNDILGGHEDGLAMLKICADDGLSDAQYEYALALADSRRFTEASQYLRLAANAGHAGAVYHLAKLEGNNRNVLEAAEMGCVEAMLDAAEMSKSIEERSRYLRGAALRGSPIAKYKLGKMMFDGVMTRNMKDGVSLMKAAADSGLIEAAKDVANAYRYGIGVPQNIEIAEAYEKMCQPQTTATEASQ